MMLDNFVEGFGCPVCPQACNQLGTPGGRKVF